MRETDVPSEGMGESEPVKEPERGSREPVSRMAHTCTHTSIPRELCEWGRGAYHDQPLGDVL